MTITVIDATEDLNTGSEALHEMAAGLTGTTHLEIALNSTTLGGIKASGTQQVIIAAAASIETQLTSIALAGASSEVDNRGSIKSLTSTAIMFSGNETNRVTNATGKTIEGVKGIEITSNLTSAKLTVSNAGTITASGMAIIGGKGGDRIENTGTIKSTATITGAVALDLGAGDDFYDGRDGTVIGIVKLGDNDDVAYGGDGNEIFSGGTGSNTIDGGGGNDTIIGGLGYSTINGGTGKDTIDYSEATASSGGTGVTVNLGSTSGYGNQFSDTLDSIENVIGSAHKDTIVGSGGENLLQGGASDDTLEGGFGSDTIEGGAGINTARFTGSTVAIVDLSKTTEQDTGYGTDTLTDIQNVEGGSGADKLTGNHQANLLDGNSGNDTLVGKEGNDTLQGEAGNDTLEGGVGNDTLDGGSSADTAVFSGARGNYSIVNNPDGTITITDNVGQDGTDTLKDIRFAKFGDQTIALTNGAPTSISPSTATVSESAAIGATVTTFFGSDPDGDTLTFSLVSDAGGLFGISDGKLVVKNALNYEAATQHTVVFKASDGWGGELTKTLTISVRNNATETTPIIRSGTAGNEQLVGEAGNDQLWGLGGNDTIFGEGGDDKLWGGMGNDTLVGSAGKDIFVFDKKPSVKSNLDWVYDFNVKDDTIHLSKSAFSKLAKKGKLSADAFVVGDHMRDKEDRILYHKKAGALFYDPDGTGSAKAIQFATITKKLAMSAKDFYVI
jgi:Ca2+-binding RTX toxin-like protein